MKSYLDLLMESIMPTANLDWCPRGDRADYKRMVKTMGGEAARNAIEDRIARREKMKTDAKARVAENRPAHKRP